MLNNFSTTHGYCDYMGNVKVYLLRPAYFHFDFMYVLIFIQKASRNIPHVRLFLSPSVTYTIYSRKY